MKRSIICLSVLIAFILTGTGAEIIYSKILSDKFEDTIEICKKADDFESKARVCDELSQYFMSNEILNNIFFTRDFTEKLGKEISDLNIYAKANDDINFNITLSRLELYTSDMPF